MQTLLLSFVTGIAYAIIGVTINVILPNEKIANWWFRFGNKAGIKVVNNVEQERWFFRPIWGCPKCFSGQLAAWCYLFFHFRAYWSQQTGVGGFHMITIQSVHYSLFCHVLTICTSIFFAVIFSSFINRIINAAD